MNKPPAFFTPEQKMSFFDAEKAKQDNIIGVIRSEMKTISEYLPGDKRHVETVKLRMKLNAARLLRENYRACGRRIKDRKRHCA